MASKHHVTPDFFFEIQQVDKSCYTHFRKSHRVQVEKYKNHNYITILWEGEREVEIYYNKFKAEGGNKRGNVKYSLTSSPQKSIDSQTSLCVPCYFAIGSRAH